METPLKLKDENVICNDPGGFFPFAQLKRLITAKKILDNRASLTLACCPQSALGWRDRSAKPFDLPQWNWGRVARRTELGMQLFRGGKIIAGCIPEMF
ncbi:MAG: hypothetical protein ACLQG3_18545 [Terracidiphilus sp.]